MAALEIFYQLTGKGRPGLKYNSLVSESSPPSDIILAMPPFSNFPDFFDMLLLTLVLISFHDLLSPWSLNCLVTSWINHDPTTVSLNAEVPNIK